jgi:hypothetical protein
MKIIVSIVCAAILFSTSGCLVPVREERSRVYVREPYPRNYYHRHHYWQHKGFDPHRYHNHYYR